MNKSGTLIVSALLTLGLAAGAMAADMPKTAAPMAADAPAATMKTTDTAKPAKKKHSKKKKAAAPDDDQVISIRLRASAASRRPGRFYFEGPGFLRFVAGSSGHHGGSLGG